VVVVAISGVHGAGKTTAARNLAKRFKLRHVCAGTIFRQLARERGMSLEEFSSYVENHPEVDRMIDERTVEEAKRDGVLIDARLAGWMAKDADIKILLTTPLEDRVRRIARREKRKYEEVLKETRAREESEVERFKKLYGIDVHDISVFDVVLNTELWPAEETAGILEKAVEYIYKR
jgi:cytidylate kinase